MHLNTSELFKDNLVKTRDEISDILNNKLNIHSEKLQSLKNLIISGEINYKYALELNQHLVKELTKIRNNNQKDAPFNLRPLTKAEAAQIQDNLNKIIDDCPNEAPSFFFDNFKKTIQRKFFNFENDTRDSSGLIEITNKEETASPNFEDLIDDYIINYTKLLNKQKDIAWNPSYLNKYVQYVEFIVYAQSGNDSILADKIYEAVEILSFNVLQKEHGGYLNSEKKQVLKNEITYFLNELVDGNLRGVESVLSAAKTRIIEKVNELFERANKEVFPSIIKEKMDKIRNKDEKQINILIDTIDSLEEERDLILGVLYQQNLDSFKRYLGGNIEALSDVDFIKCEEIYNSHFSRPNSHLNEFMNERNEYSVIIEKQLSQSEGSYFAILNEIKSLKLNVEDSKQRLLLYFYQSIELFASELKETVIGVLDYSFFEFLGKEYLTVAKEYQKRIAQLDHLQKTNMLIFLNNFKAKFKDVSVNIIIEQIKKDKGFKFIPNDELSDFLEYVDELILAQISVNLSAEDISYFKNNKSKIQNSLKYDQDKEDARLTFNILSAVFTGAAGIIASSTGGLAIALGLGIAGVSPSIWEKLSRNTSFYEEKYKEFISIYLDKIENQIIAD
jgi:hypothetical protein